MVARTILVVEDDALLRELLASVLSAHGFVVETAASAAEAKRVFRRGDHDGLVLDIELGPGPNGFDLADALLREAPHVAIVFLTNLPDPRFANRDPAGLPDQVAYLRKTALADVESLVQAVDATLRGASTRAHRHDRDPDRPLGGLTRKQVDVLRMIAQGMSNAQIAQVRGVSVKAVEDTVSRACLALGIDSTRVGNVRVAAARRYLELTAGTVASTPEQVDGG